MVSLRRSVVEWRGVVVKEEKMGGDVVSCCGARGGEGGGLRIWLIECWRSVVLVVDGHKGHTHTHVFTHTHLCTGGAVSEHIYLEIELSWAMWRELIFILFIFFRLTKLSFK